MNTAIAPNLVEDSPKVESSAKVPASPANDLARGVLVLIALLSAFLLLELVVMGAVQANASQLKAFQKLRANLANGTVPIGPLTSEGKAVPAGSPISYLEIPAIGLRQVVVEGTTSANLFTGPGHRRDTPLPGQAGVSVILGRRATFGGAFSRIHDLHIGDQIRMTTGQGVFTYKVLGVRRDGDPLPPTIASGEGRLMLVTADGRPFMPSGVLRVDAEMTKRASAGPARLVSAQSLPGEEQIMGSTKGPLWGLVMWVQALGLVLVAGVWAWHRWGRVQAWVVGLPVFLLVAQSAAGEAARMLPNLL